MKNNSSPLTLTQYERPAWIAGGAGLVLCVIGGIVSPMPFFWGYLYAYEVWAGLALGCLALWMLHHLAGGRWGISVRRIWEAGGGTMLWMAVLFIPVILGFKYLYPWANPTIVAGDPLLQHKAPYLNPLAQVLRAVVYFAVWVGFTVVLRRWSLKFDRDGDTFSRLRNWSGLGLVLYLLTVTFSSVDWVMSLETTWFSTMYGLIFAGGQVMSAMCLAILVVYALRERDEIKALLTPQQLNDLGNLLIAMVMVWAYFDFFQYLIIWFGNLPVEIDWYLRRITGGWAAIILLLVVFQFALPFVLLMFRGLKRNPRPLFVVAALIFAFRFLEVYWLVIPASDGAVGFHWTHLAALIGIGGVWTGAFLRGLRAAPLLPREPAPVMKEAP